MQDSSPPDEAAVLRRLEFLVPTSCHACRGRVLALRGDGRSNAERGHRRSDEAGGSSASPCPFCEGISERVPDYVRLCLAAADGIEFGTFLVGTVIPPEIRDREQALFDALSIEFPDARSTAPPRAGAPSWPWGEWLKNQINREVGKEIEARTGKKVDFQRPELTFRLDTRFDHVELQIADAYVRGRYRKLARDLPQTRWPCRACGGLGCRQCGGGGKTYESSVEELVAGPLVERSGAEGEAFHGMGREDIDARALGTGRPFVLELKRPRRRRFELADLPDAIRQGSNGRVEVSELAFADPDTAARYKAADPAKTYRARCRADEAVPREKLLRIIPSLAGATLHQRTPQRVAHRRSDLVRARRILDLKLLDTSGDRFELEIRADAGTYIKEFVSGDEGRTEPSLAGALGTPVRVEELDIVDIDWKE